MKACKKCGAPHGTRTVGCHTCYMREVYYRRPDNAARRKADSAAYYLATKDDPKRAEQRARWVRNNPDAARLSARRATAAQRARFQSAIDAAKAVPCAKCGLQHPPRAMDFHHREPADKLFSISQVLYGGGPIAAGSGMTRMDLLLSEIDKCDVLCAVCHRLHHAPPPEPEAPPYPAANERGERRVDELIEWSRQTLALYEPEALAVVDLACTLDKEPHPYA